MRSFVFPLFSGDWGTRQTVYHMRSLARGGAVNPLVRQLALDATHGIHGADSDGQIAAIRDFLESHIWFTRDPSISELLYTPERMALLLRDPAQGGILKVDCDDAAILAAALGMAIGLRARFVVVGLLSPNAPYRHVWTELASPLDSNWYEMDVTRGSQAINPTHITRRLVVEV